LLDNDGDVDSVVRESLALSVVDCPLREQRGPTLSHPVEKLLFTHVEKRLLLAGE
jgi:hypothetical protein